MKLNNVKNDNEDIDFLEVDRLYMLLLVKYSERFTRKRASEIALILYLNGIRHDMFFLEKYDIDEIVDYVDEKYVDFNKVIKICRKREYYCSDEDMNNGNTKNGQIINFNDYLRFKGRR